jgi:hypothetical protein
MPVIVTCLYCHAKIRASEKLEGKKTHCPKCHMVILIQPDATVVELAKKPSRAKKSLLRNPVSWLAVAIGCLFVIAFASKLASHFNSQEEVGITNARNYALEWFRRTTNDKEAELMPDVQIRRLQWETQLFIPDWTREDLEPLSKAWGGKGQVWYVHGKARSKKIGWVYSFDFFAHRKLKGWGRDEEWNVLPFELDGPNGRYPSLFPAYQVKP